MYKRKNSFGFGDCFPLCNSLSHWHICILVSFRIFCFYFLFHHYKGFSRKEDFQFYSILRNIKFQPQQTTFHSKCPESMGWLLPCLASPTTQTQAPLMCWTGQTLSSGSEIRSCLLSIRKISITKNPNKLFIWKSLKYMKILTHLYALYGKFSSLCLVK